MVPFRVLHYATASGIPVSGRHVKLLYVYCTLVLCKLSEILYRALVKHSQRAGKRVTENLWNFEEEFRSGDTESQDAMRYMGLVVEI